MYYFHFHCFLHLVLSFREDSNCSVHIPYKQQSDREILKELLLIWMLHTLCTILFDPDNVRIILQMNIKSSPRLT